MRIAIVGSGISGLTAGYLLHGDHEITVFEAEDHIGGHTNTVRVELDGEVQHVDTGFIVYNEANYQDFARLLDRLGVETQATSMSFSVRCERTGLEYNGTSINALFAQRRNALRPAFWRMVRDIVRFNRRARRLLEAEGSETTVGEYARSEGYSEEFVEQYLVPLGSSIWSCPAGRFREFPVRFVARFFHNHGLLQVYGRPGWRVIRGGSFRYVEALTRGFRDRIQLRRPVRRVTRHADSVEVTAAEGEAEQFDHAILACHADQALGLLADASAAEREILGAFPYQRNDTILHTDTRVLPRKRLAWASWNYHIPRSKAERVSITYDMNILQSLGSRREFCVTLNDEGAVEAGSIIRRMTYHHPIYTVEREAAQARRGEMINANRTSYCGAYWGYGFHEDGVRSALEVCRVFGKSL